MSSRSASWKSVRGTCIALGFAAGLAALALGGASCNTVPPTPAPGDPEIDAQLAPAPRLPVGFYDYFGALKSPAEARRIVQEAGLDPNLPASYLHVGLVHITEKLIADGREAFTKQPLGDPFTLNNIVNLANTVGKTGLDIALDSLNPAADPSGSLTFLRDLFVTLLIRPKVMTTNLQVMLSRDLKLGSSTFRAGTLMDVGLDVAAGAILPVGLEGVSVNCALCHSSLDPATGEVVAGRPNTDLNIGLFIALSPNSAAVFLKLNRADFDPFDPRFPLTGRRIIDSQGNTVQLPDPLALEAAMDDYVLAVPRGGFDAAPDATTAITKIPDAFVFGEGGMGWDGGFQVGPFGGVAAFANAVHAFEINLLSPANFSRRAADLDPEVYLGLVLQNSPDPALRFPDDVRPSEWLYARYPLAERERLGALPHWPQPSLFSLNGLFFAPPDETALYSTVAVSAFQSSLVCPPNRSLENMMNIESGAVRRGARVFLDAGCTSCHPAPFFTDGSVVTTDQLNVNEARGANRVPLTGELVESVIPALDEPMPLRPDAVFITLPPAPGAASNLVLPPGLDTPTGGYKVTGLIGAYFRAPYLHDAGVSVAADALSINADGSYAIADAAGIGVPGTTKAGRRPPNAAHSMRALLDRDLRAVVVASNHADVDLQRQNVEGRGHEFFVDPAAGFTYQQQTDLIAFLLALDDNPGEF